MFARFLPVLRIQVEENSQSGPVDPAVSLCTEACQILRGDPQHPPEAVRKKAEVFLSRWSISQGRYHEHTPKGISGCCRREHCFLPREIGKLTIGKLLSCQSFLLKMMFFRCRISLCHIWVYTPSIWPPNQLGL